MKSQHDRNKKIVSKYDSGKRHLCYSLINCNKQFLELFLIYLFGNEHYIILSTGVLDQQPLPRIKLIRELNHTTSLGEAQPIKFREASSRAEENTTISEPCTMMPANGLVFRKLSISFAYFTVVINHYCQFGEF